jgi:hypothetical protein
LILWATLLRLIVAERRRSSRFPVGRQREFVLGLEYDGGTSSSATGATSTGSRV